MVYQIGGVEYQIGDGYQIGTPCFQLLLTTLHLANNSPWPPHNYPNMAPKLPTVYSIPKKSWSNPVSINKVTLWSHKKVHLRITKYLWSLYCLCFGAGNKSCDAFNFFVFWFKTVLFSPWVSVKVQISIDTLKKVCDPLYTCSASAGTGINPSYYFNFQHSNRRCRE